MRPTPAHLRLAAMASPTPRRPAHGAPATAPTTALSTALATALWLVVAALGAPAQAQPTGLPPAAPACVGLAPPASPPPHSATRAVVEGHLEVPLPEPFAPGQAACLWPIGAAEARLQVVGAQPCQPEAHHCARIVLARADAERTFDVSLGGAWVRVTVPPAQSPIGRNILYFLVFLGLVGSLLLTTWLAQQGRVWLLRRKWTVLETRLRHSPEDRHAIRLRIQAMLSFVKHVLFMGAPTSLRDLDLADERLREADQLLRLSERKTLLWTRADAQRLPPSAQQRFNAELRLFDREILQLPLPLPEAQFEAAVPASLARALRLLEAVETAWDAGNQALLKEVRDAPSGLSLVALAPMAGGGEALALFTEALEHERARLRVLDDAQRAPDAGGPAARFEADLRLDLVRCLREACHRIQTDAEADRSHNTPRPPGDGSDPYGAAAGARADAEPSADGSLDPRRDLHRRHFAQPATLRQIRRALRAWRGADPTREEAREAHLELVRLLRWEPENAAVRAWLTDVPAPDIRVEPARLGWRTYTPEPLPLRIRDPDHQDKADDYCWRAQLEVAWRCTTPGKRVYFGGRAMGKGASGPYGPTPDPQVDDWFISRGPTNMAFVAEAGVLQIQAFVRAPHPRADQHHPWRPLAVLELSVSQSVDEGRATQFLATAYLRLLLSGLSTFMLAPAIVAQAAAEPSALLSVLTALLLPLGIDQGGLAAARGLKGVREAVAQLRPGPRPPA